jgi:hypothetical protein
MVLVGLRDARQPYVAGVYPMLLDETCFVLAVRFRQSLALQKELRGDGNPPRPPGLVRERASLQAPWPPLAAMEHGDDLQTLAAHSVRNEIPCAWHHELTSPGHPAGTPEVRELRQAIDCSQ